MQNEHLGKGRQHELARVGGQIELERAILDPMLDAREVIALGIPGIGRAVEGNEQGHAADEDKRGRHEPRKARSSRCRPADAIEKSNPGCLR